ncbi:siderophore-interacting protein [Planotetraspora thailandica]|uniref:Siderophore-interacting protein n=1 Tax=Planotetraspora thailandica TaxID=487172 RepID=A0A8J3Y109_9ACTN|nr:siderophore-interacting protein [Planotetraspora thailandica]GII58789.1 siderophore-interacting protein [Planotetraspora thailandica]
MPYRDTARPRVSHAATITSICRLTPRMVRVTAAAESLVGVQIRPAQDIELLLDDGDGPRVKRRYTVRRARPDVGEIDVDVLVHGRGPGSRWASTTRPGDVMEFVGPRGKLELRPADWHLFACDEAGLPAIAALIEAIGRQATTLVLAEIGCSSDRLPLMATSVRWLHRGQDPAGTPALLERQITGLCPPEGTGRAYLFGESRVVAGLRGLMPALGLAPEGVFAKGYWNRRP